MTKRGIEEIGFNQKQQKNTSSASSNPSSNNSHGEDRKEHQHANNHHNHNNNLQVLNLSNGTESYVNGTSSGSSGSSTNGSLEGNKKFKGDSNHSNSPHSRVVHIRHIPIDTTTQELLALASQFGVVTKHLIVRSKYQAFVEFESYFSAMQMASFWLQTTINGMPSQAQPTIRGRNVIVQMSNHKELKMNFENGSSSSSSSTDALMASEGYSMDTSSGANNSSNNSNTPSTILHVIIENQIYPFGLDAIYQLFSRCGQVLKIITFTRNQQFQALVQFQDLAGAMQAKASYEDQSTNPGILPGFPLVNVMRIEYSKLQNLTVKYNNDKSRDYTGEMPLDPNHEGVAAEGYLAGPTAAALALNGTHAASPYGHTNRNHQLQCATSISRALSTVLATGNCLITPPNTAAAALLNATGNLMFTSVVHVSGLNQEHVTPDALFTLFGVYGDVIRVKILYHKKDSALIQMAEPTQAQNAISYLDGLNLYGRKLHVMTSKHHVVQMPIAGHVEAGLTKDYTNSPLHRFKRPGSKNYNNIYPPSETLHVSNIPSSCTEEDLRKAFKKEADKQIVKFKFFPNDRRMALVHFETVEDAVDALIKMHNYKFCLKCPTIIKKLPKHEPDEHNRTIPESSCLTQNVWPPYLWPNDLMI